MQELTLKQLQEATGGAVITAPEGASAAPASAANTAGGGALRGFAMDDIAVGPEAIENIRVSNVTIDSRTAQEGSLFVAIPGERVDGHNYIGKAFELGATVAVAEKEVELPPEGKAILRVANTVEALGKIGKYYKKQFPLFTVGVTGSIGKTSCKDFVHAALSGRFTTMKTQGNLNSIYGVPLTFFQLQKETQAAVIEMGMDYAGEIDYMAGLTEPDIGIITNVGNAHIEHFPEDGQLGILKAKMEIAPHIKKDGLLLLNGDDALLRKIADSGTFEPNVSAGRTGAAVPRSTRPTRSLPRIKTYGFSEGCDAHILLSELTEDAQLHVVIETNRRYDLVLPVLGIHMALNAAAAILTAEAAGLTQEEIEKGLKSIVLTPHRMQRVELPKYHVIDDAYNAGPASMIGALKTLSYLPGGRRKVAILGDIFELGAYSKGGHEEVGRYAATLPNLSELICVGPESIYMAKAAKEAGMETVHYFPDLDALYKNLFTIVQEDDIILIKASHGMDFPRILTKLQES